MMVALARLPLTRLRRSPRNLLAIVAWIALAVVAACVENNFSAKAGADRALLGTFGTVALPLLVYAVVGATLSGDGLHKAVKPMIAFGALPWRAVVSTVLSAMLVSALLSGILAGAVTLIAGSSRGAADAATSTWVAALAGASYAAWFSMGASFGARGSGRPVLLVVDYLFGAASGTSALITPRGNLRSLLGGPAPHDVSQRVNSTLLVVIALLCVLVCIRRGTK